MIKKSFVKFLSAIMAAFLLAEILAVSTTAEKAEANEKNIYQVAEQSETGYEKYLSKYQNISDAEFDIEVKADDFTAPDGTVVIKNNTAKWNEASGRISANVNVSKTGFYNIGISYKHFGESSADIKIDVTIDGKLPFGDCEGISLNRLWVNETDEPQIDDEGNEFAPEQIPYGEYSVEYLSDDSGVVTVPYRFGFTEGSHTITVAASEGILEIDKIILSAPEVLSSYSEVKKQYEQAGYEPTASEPIVLQGEKADIKSSSSIVPSSDKASVNIEPSNPYKNVLNYIGGSNWGAPGDYVTWKVYVQKAGLYKLSFRYMQREVINTTTYRKLLIDGKTPFDEAAQIPFAYCRNWSLKNYSDTKGEAYEFYLDEGEHEITLCATLGPTAELYKRLSEIVSNIGDRYLQIIMITGETPDANRDYELFNQIPDFNESLEIDKEALLQLALDMEKINGEEGSQCVAALRNMARVLENMIENKYTAHNYVSDYYNNYTTVSSWLNDMCSMPLSIDSIILSAPKYELKEKIAGGFASVLHGIKRFIYSFTEDYINESKEETTDIKLWVNWGRDQAQILNNLIKNSFTPETGIKVKFEIVNTGIIKGLLSGDAPDISLMLTRSEPVNLAMRGALYDLKNFDDFEEVTERFQPGATTPYEYKNGCYALPDTQSFFVMFYRRDVLDTLGLSLPTTWEEFTAVSSKILRNNMQVSLPYTKIAASTTTDAGVGNLTLCPTLLMQNGVSVYNDELNACNLATEKAISVFDMFTEYYSDYRIIKEANFYNRFRLGTMPLGIANYSLYMQIQTAAPEIDGKWGIAMVPGTVREDGSISNTVAGAGTGAVILNESKNKEASWEFLKWWTRADTQFSYNESLENVLGSIARVATSNVEAFTNIAWDKEHEKILLKQWGAVTEVPETPGSYYLGRAIDQAFWEVMNDKSTPREALTEWSRTANNEIKRKIAEYS